MIGRLYNNFGICSAALGFCLNESKNLNISSALLIMPLITNQELLAHLSHASTNFESVEQLIIKKPICFSNFNARFYDGLTVTINAIQFLNETNYLKVENESCNQYKKNGIQSGHG